jgi:hypothetical protein
VPEDQWALGRDGKKLALALKLLEDDAYHQLRGAHKPWSVSWFALVGRQWRDYQRGIVPSRENLGRGGQNPHLLAAFSALDHAENRSQETRRQEIERQRQADQNHR